MSLRVENLHKSFQQAETAIEVLRGVDFKVDRGESLAIVGQSGSGKSTLLALLAGLDAPSDGGVYLGDRPLHAFSQTELALFRSQRLGIVFQQFHLMRDLNATENVALPLDLQGRPFRENVDKAIAALKQVGLGHRYHHYPRQLSGGECQRVAIARALVTRPEILLADEPTGNLDEATSTTVANLLFELAKQNNTGLVLVTHSQHLASRCDRVLELVEGQLRPLGQGQVRPSGQG